MEERRFVAALYQFLDLLYHLLSNIIVTDMRCRAGKKEREKGGNGLRWRENER
jgi:hypothetical protein